MSIEFEEQNNNLDKKFFENKENKMAKWLQDMGIASNENIAKYILIGVIVVAVALTILVLKSGTSKSYTPNNQNQSEANGLSIEEVDNI